MAGAALAAGLLIGATVGAGLGWSAAVAAALLAWSRGAAGARGRPLDRPDLHRCDENTIGVVAVLGSTFDGSYER